MFTPHSDVPDDSLLRLVFLPPEKFYSKQESKLAFEEVLTYVRNNGSKPRYKSNQLVFIAPDFGSLSRLRDCIRTALAWNSIVEDVNTGRLNIDRLQEQQAKKEFQTAEEVLPRVARECYKWILCPVMMSPTDRQPLVEVFPLNTGGSSFGTAIEHVCQENELIITTWSPIHLRNKLKDLYWKDGKATISAMQLWEDMQRYLFMPRMKNRSVLEQTIMKGAGSKDFFGTAYAQNGEEFEGFKFGDSNVQFDDTLLLIDPEVAKKYEASKPLTVKEPEAGYSSGESGTGTTTTDPIPAGGGVEPTPGSTSGTTQTAKVHSFYGSVEVNAATAKMRMVQLAEEVINVLASDPNASLKITVEINAEFPSGVSDQIKRAVSENAKSLGFKNKTWE
jgi:hypothetical protein